LTAAEVGDLWGLAQRVGSMLEEVYGVDSLTLTVQDGVNAGQSVPHVHVHVVPRKPGDFEPNDRIYDVLDGSESTMGSGGSAGSGGSGGSAGSGSGGGAGHGTEAAGETKSQGPGRVPGPGRRLDEEARVARSPEEMAAEAAIYRDYFAKEA
jgi:hypothetical protein